MKIDNPFDKKNDLYRENSKMPESVLDAAVRVTDRLDLCWSMAQSVFEDKATPADAIAIFRLVQEEESLLSRQYQHYIDSIHSHSSKESDSDA